MRHYGAWMRNEAEQRIGHLYPKVKVTKEMADTRADLKGLVDRELTVIAWLWARTVKSPNPAFSHVDVPLVSSFVLASKPGKEAWVKAVVDGDTYRLVVRTGKWPQGTEDGTKLGRGANFRCVLSGAAIDGDYIKAEGQSGRLGARLLAVVAEGQRARVYLSAAAEDTSTAASAAPTWRPAGAVPARLTGGTCVPYGLATWGDLFTPRQLVALTTFSDLVGEARAKAAEDAVSAGMPDDDVGLEDGGRGARAYGEAVGVYCGMAVSRYANPSSTLCTWNPAASKEDIRYTFSRQALPMTWDFAEGNPFSESSGNFGDAFETWLGKSIAALPACTGGVVVTGDAQRQGVSAGKVVSTDPPYYDNIGYADLSDFFYVWLRRSLREVLPSLFATIAVPKAEELVATPYRHGSREAAEDFFLTGMTQAMSRLATQSHPSSPVTIYYAFKQSETGETSGTSSTGWETFLEAVLRAGFALSGTWPMRTERGGRSIGVGTNALASSIVLVCRRRPDTAATIGRREFIRELNTVLPLALDEMTKGAGHDRSPVAPVDLSQAIIGPGMAVFSKYAAVLEANGEPMSVKTALQLINRFLAEDDFDADTQFCLHWFDQHGWNDGAFGDADVLARAKATSVSGLDHAGVLVSGGGKVRLRRPADYPADWDPRADTRLPVWEALHQLIRAYRAEGESTAGRLLGAVQSKGEAIRQLAYRLYTLCEREGLADDARAYNDLVTGWTGIETVANAAPVVEAQGRLFGEE